MNVSIREFSNGWMVTPDSEVTGRFHPSEAIKVFTDVGEMFAYLRSITKVEKARRVPVLEGEKLF